MIFQSHKGDLRHKILEQIHKHLNSNPPTVNQRYLSIYSCNTWCGQSVSLYNYLGFIYGDAGCSHQNICILFTRREREIDKEKERETKQRVTYREREKYNIFLFAPSTFKAASYWCFMAYNNFCCSGCIQCKYTPYKVCWNKYMNTTIPIDTWFFFVVYIFFLLLAMPF
jgi:hypothetical protein